MKDAMSGKDPKTYEEALALLRETPHGHLTLTFKTHLDAHDDQHGRPWTPAMGRPPDCIMVKYRSTAIVTYFPNGSYLLNGPCSNTTKSRLNRFTPFKIFSYRASNVVAGSVGVRPFFSAMLISSEGGILNAGDEWMNEFDAAKYIEVAQKHASLLARLACKGKLGSWTIQPRRSSIDIVRAVLARECSGALLLEAVSDYTKDDYQSRKQLGFALHELIPTNYQKIWPASYRSTAEEVNHYAKQLIGEARPPPTDMKGLFRYYIRCGLLAPLRLQY